MPGKAYSALVDVAVDQHGFVTTDDARTVGVSPAALRAIAHRGDAERISQGLYRLRIVPVGDHDQLMEATLWPRGQGVISHDTALGLWELCDVNPAKVHVTVPAAARIRRQAPPAYAVHVRDRDPEDITRVDGIPVVTARRAILDGIDRHLDGRLIDQAVRTARRTGLLRRAAVAEITAARPAR